MKSLTGKRRAGLLTFIVLLGPALFGQKEPQLPKIGIQVNLVSLDVEVLDRKGSLIQGLDKSDFIVEENGKQMEISNFALSTGRPISLAAVLDTSALPTSQLSICKEFLLIFAHKLDHADELCLYSFDARNAFLEQDWTTDRPLLMRALDNIGVPSKRSPGVLIELFGPEPRTALAIDRALLKLKEARNPKRILLLISNRFRGLGPVTVEHVQQSGCTLITLAFPHKTTMLVSLGGDEISAHQLMRESGGRSFSAVAEDTADVCRQVVNSLKNYYSIGYYTEIKDGDKKPRKIRVRVPDRKCAVHFRRTYIPG
ncbi:MAG TPA: VWA domain-containing protein [Acidobacteriota bacterium]|nr:VWA domain-containing protein [Acidobacteriota bacterium]